jgi:hypothetical protein
MQYGFCRILATTSRQPFLNCGGIHNGQTRISESVYSDLKNGIFAQFFSFYGLSRISFTLPFDP